jgi:predicted nuclease with TOPRIM domain
MSDNPFRSVEINQNLYNLYTILLQYFKRLLAEKHPKIHLIQAALDGLITIRSDTSLEDNEELLKERFDEIHSLAYKNINELYEYDKQMEEFKKAQSVLENIECSKFN